MSLFIFNKQLEYYVSIDDLPIKRWFKIQKTNDISWLLLKQKNISKTQKLQLDAAFRIIWMEYINTFGLSETLSEILHLKRDIQILKTDMYLNKDRSRLGLIRVKQRELDALINKSENTEFDNTKSYVEKFMSFRIDENTTTVKDYYGYLEMMKQASKNAEKNQTADVGQD